ncbi:dendritic cell-specific transmembrane protein [Sphaeramia orbicularis]|uniref:dendritic cell-specific transmembrane protein n=1 Tax=Sphaeramia orbicularis TaxID=375764 RepID=UPI00117CFBDF|nr:dendritic cell-specific transmembrane protein [Sphaeramia orbicularis]
MLLSWITIKQSLEDFGCLVLDVFTTGKRDGVKRTTILLLSCSVSGLLLSSLLLLYLLYSLDYEAAVAGGITGCVGTLLTVALFQSKKVRCLGTLFVISIFMKKSRNLLLTAGTSLVVLRNIRNTLENLTDLVRSMICNLKAKKAAISAPFSNYVKMLKWLGDVLRGVTDLGVVNLDSQLKISPKVESEKFRERLIEAERTLNETVTYAQVLMNTVSSVMDKMFPAVSFLLLMMFIILQVRRYCNDMKYKNRFITRRFICLDEKLKAEGKPHVLPLTVEEEKLYLHLPSARPTRREGKAAVKFGLPVISHFILWVIFITVDALLYVFVDIITRRLSEMEPFHVPLLMSIKGIASLIGIQIAEENHHKDFSYSVTLFEEQCLPKPKLLLSSSVVPLAAILFTLLIMAAMASKASQLRLMVCERFYTTAADERAECLHAKILRKRRKRRKEETGDSSLRSVFLKPHFWCPLLFRLKEDPKNLNPLKASHLHIPIPLHTMPSTVSDKRKEVVQLKHE